MKPLFAVGFFFKDRDFLPESMIPTMSAKAP